MELEKIKKSSPSDYTFSWAEEKFKKRYPQGTLLQWKIVGSNYRGDKEVDILFLEKKRCRKIIRKIMWFPVEETAYYLAE